MTIKNILKEFHFLKKCGLFIILAPLSLSALQQSNVIIPDSIALYNSSDASIEVSGKIVESGQSITIEPNEKGMFVVKSNKRKYLISHPVFNPHNAVHLSINTTRAFLDFATIAWLAGDVFKLYPQGLDSVQIHNDTYYPIAALFVLSAHRSPSRRIEAQETISKIVSTQDNQKTGFLELIDSNRKKHTLSFPRRLYTRNSMNTSDWHEITLCAQTISWFSDNGFKVSVR